MSTEADTCRKYVVPKLLAAGWDDDPHSIAEQRTITDGRIIPAGKGFIRKPPKRVDYLLRYARDFPLAVVEAKAGYKSASDGLQQAKAYAEMLGLKFAYATNGHEIIEFDYPRACLNPTPILQRIFYSLSAEDPQNSFGFMNIHFRPTGSILRGKVIRQLTDSDLKNSSRFFRGGTHLLKMSMPGPLAFMIFSPRGLT